MTQVMKFIEMTDRFSEEVRIWPAWSARTKRRPAQRDPLDEIRAEQLVPA